MLANIVLPSQQINKLSWRGDLLSQDRPPCSEAKSRPRLESDRSRFPLAVAMRSNKRNISRLFIPLFQVYIVCPMFLSP